MIRKPAMSKPIQKVVSRPEHPRNIAQRMTHQYLNDKYLRKIGSIKAAGQLSVLYLHNNEISRIENLEKALNLTSLYLQKNKIQRIENLEYLTNLRKLYLGHNEISVVEGLESQRYLEELHLEKQNLPEGVFLCFEPRSMFAISRTLQVLNISCNKINSITCLAPLRYLKILNAANNNLEDIEEVCSTIRNLFYLTEATFIGNPMAKKHRYRETIIASTYCLGELDSRRVTEETRSFIKRFEKEKMLRGSKQSINLADDIPNIPKNYPPPIQKAVSASIIRDAKKHLIDDYEVFDERDAVFIAWNSLPKREATVPKSILKKPQRQNLDNIINMTFAYPFTK